MKIVLTGASSGIGRALSYEFCRDGASIVLGVGRNRDALNSIKQDLGECFIPLVVDLRELSSIDVVVDVARKNLGQVDVLVNNAGFGLYKRVVEHSVEDVYGVTMVNFVIPIVLTNRLLPIMKPGSVVVNIITAGVHVLMTKLPIYGAAKIALHYATEILREELKSRGIHVVSVYPGYVETEFHRRAGAVISGRGLRPDEVAREIVYAVKRKRSTVYIPRYLKILKILGPHSIKI